MFSYIPLFFLQRMFLLFLFLYLRCYMFQRQTLHIVRTLSVFCENHAVTNQNLYFKKYFYNYICPIPKGSRFRITLGLLPAPLLSLSSISTLAPLHPPTLPVSGSARLLALFSTKPCRGAEARYPVHGDLVTALLILWTFILVSFKVWTFSIFTLCWKHSFAAFLSCSILL